MAESKEETLSIHEAMRRFVCELTAISLDKDQLSGVEKLIDFITDIKSHHLIMNIATLATMKTCLAIFLAALYSDPRTYRREAASITQEATDETKTVDLAADFYPIRRICLFFPTDKQAAGFLVLLARFLETLTKTKNAKIEASGEMLIMRFIDHKDTDSLQSVLNSGEYWQVECRPAKSSKCKGLYADLMIHMEGEEATQDDFANEVLAPMLRTKHAKLVQIRSVKESTVGMVDDASSSF